MITRGITIASRYGITSWKMDRALGQLSSTLKQSQCQATIPITALALSRNLNAAKFYYSQGLELAIHGLTHVDYRNLSAETQYNHIQQAKHIYEQSGIKVTGFRCPYLRWNNNTLDALKISGFDYDSSQAIDMGVTSGIETSSYRQVLEFYQAQFASQYPILPHQEEGLVRIPYCLPDDEAIIERLRISDSQLIADIWLAMLERAYNSGELFTLGLHPERAHLCIDALHIVLTKARSSSPPVWIARLNEITSWYCTLGNSTFETRQECNGRFWVKINTSQQATILIRSLEVDESTKPWVKGYRIVMSPEFYVLNNKHPFIGLSPDTPLNLRIFLRNQGYLIEISSEPQIFPFYLDRTNFKPEDERQLLDEIEGGDWPLVRLARWPNASQCALSITGDIDAFTICDFGQRFLGERYHG